VKDLSPKIK
jgi:hypothetical protein